MIDIGERAGSGIPNIYRVWREQGWAEPTITQTFEPDRTTLSLRLSPTTGDKSAIKIGDKNATAIKAVKRQMIIDYLTDHSVAKAAEIAEFVDLKPSRVRDCLAELAGSLNGCLLSRVSGVRIPDEAPSLQVEMAPQPFRPVFIRVCGVLNAVFLYSNFVALFAPFFSTM